MLNCKTFFKEKSLFLIFLVVMAVFHSQAVLASQTDGTISGYAWSSQIGWINFGWANGNAQITDSTVTGYAWNENKGRINLNPTQSGVVNNSEGTLSGQAWCEGTGWINFSGVTVNSSGVFSGTATGDNSVSISFDCDNCNVTTDWRPASSRTSARPNVSGGGGGGGGTSDGTGGGTYNGSFSILINNGAQYTNSKSVSLYLEGGAEADKMTLSNFPDFKDAVQENYQKNKAWTLEEKDGLKTVYVKFYNKQGVVSSVLTANIILDTQVPFLKITNIKDIYYQGGEVIVGGLAEGDAHIIFSWNGKYGISKSDTWGNWLVTLGKMGLGQYSLSVFARDPAGNESVPITAGFTVKKGEIVPAPKPEIPVLPPTENPPLPPPVVVVPEITPEVFNDSFKGYVYEKSGDTQTRIPRSVVSLYWLNPATKEYELWPAKDFQQENAQITDKEGTYSFMVPSGHYYLKAEAPGYSTYESKTFELKEAKVIHFNIELKKQNWWSKVLDWKVMLFILLIALFSYLFYLYRKRKKSESSQ